MKCFFKVTFVLPFLLLMCFISVLQIPLMLLSAILNVTGCFPNIYKYSMFFEPIIFPAAYWFERL